MGCVECEDGSQVCGPGVMSVLDCDAGGGGSDLCPDPDEDDWCWEGVIKISMWRSKKDTCKYKFTMYRKRHEDRSCDNDEEECKKRRSAAS